MAIFLWTWWILMSIFFGGVRCQDKVHQEKLMVSQVGENCTITCQYEATNFYSLHWYRQYLGEKPTYLFQLVSDKVSQEPNFSAELDQKNRASQLHITSVEFGNSATYFCAVGPGGGYGKLIFGSGTKLVVRPDLEPSLPSVYKLKPSSEEKQGKAACLFTDYSPNPLNVGINKEVTKEVNGSVVVVKEDKSEKGTASYGIVLWGNDTDSFHCHADAENPKGDSGTCLAEDGDITFETDERLNLLSFTVLGLRVIFLKTVSFNLLLTFRLWSR